MLWRTLSLHFTLELYLLVLIEPTVYNVISLQMIDAFCGTETIIEMGRSINQRIVNKPLISVFLVIL